MRTRSVLDEQRRQVLLVEPLEGFGGHGLVELGGRGRVGDRFQIGRAPDRELERQGLAVAGDLERDFAEDADARDREARLLTGKRAGHLDTRRARSVLWVWCRLRRRGWGRSWRRADPEGNARRALRPTRWPRPLPEAPRAER